jgi:hypothetical protein
MLCWNKFQRQKQEARIVIVKLNEKFQTCWCHSIPMQTMRNWFVGVKRCTNHRIAISFICFRTARKNKTIEPKGKFSLFRMTLSFICVIRKSENKTKPITYLISNVHRKLTCNKQVVFIFHYKSDTHQTAS